MNWILEETLKVFKVTLLIITGDLCGKRKCDEDRKRMKW